MAIIVVVVEAIADDEGVRDLEAEVIGCRLDFAAAQFPEQYDRADAGRSVNAEFSEQSRKSPSCVEDVIDQQHVASFNVGQQA